MVFSALFGFCVCQKLIMLSSSVFAMNAAFIERCVDFPTLELKLSFVSTQIFWSSDIISSIVVSDDGSTDGSSNETSEFHTMFVYITP